MINNDWIITLCKNFIHVTIHHSWKAGQLYCKEDVNNEMELNKIVLFFFSFPMNPLGRSVSYVVSEKKVKIDHIFTVLSYMVALLS